MPRFLIELPHENSKKSCDLALNILKRSGSHFLTHADLGCPDDVHVAWLNIDADNRADALRIVPPFYRDKARIIKLQRLSLDNVDKSLKTKHK